jgi:hypothetical protein
MAVLGACLLVTVIGLAAMAAVRLEARQTVRAEQTARARLLARSAAELALSWMARDPDWRQRLAHDTWGPGRTMLGGESAYRLRDPVDADLTNDPMHPVHLDVRATVGEATQLLSLRLDARDPATALNLTPHGDLEEGTVGWGAKHGAELVLIEDSPRGGAFCLRATNRSVNDAGPTLDLTSVLENGRTYTCRAYVRMASGTAMLRADFYLRDDQGQERWYYGTYATAGGAWTPITTTVEPTWTAGAELVEAFVKIETLSELGDVDVDDVVVVEGGSIPEAVMTPVGASWRQALDD